MGYEKSLEKAGAKIIAFKEFGSYQGTWLAFVEYNGEKGIVEGSYGSCSGCDSFKAEFNYTDEPSEKDGKYYKTYWADEDECTEEEFNQAVLDYDLKLANFGKSYLEPMYDKAHYERRLSQLDREDWFDEETKEYCQWAVEQLS
jgi:hypothetical protein